MCAPVCCMQAYNEFASGKHLQLCMYVCPQCTYRQLFTVVHETLPHGSVEGRPVITANQITAGELQQVSHAINTNLS